LFESQTPHETQQRQLFNLVFQRPLKAEPLVLIDCRWKANLQAQLGLDTKKTAAPSPRCGFLLKLTGNARHFQA
jgi:hypothetical protein